MNHADRVVCGDENEFEHLSVAGCTDDEDADLAVVFLLSVSDHVVECVEDVGVFDAVLSCTPLDVHCVIISLTPTERQYFVDA